MKEVEEVEEMDEVDALDEEGRAEGALAEALEAAVLGHDIWCTRRMI